MQKNKVNLRTLSINKDKGVTTPIPPKAEGTTLSPENVARINASEFLGKDLGKTEMQALAEGTVGGEAAEMEGTKLADGATRTEVRVGMIDPTKVPVYVLAKKYVPKTDRNIETWNKILAALKDGPKTLAQLTKAVETHKDFVGYMVRGGHIAPQAKEQAPAVS